MYARYNTLSGATDIEAGLAYLAGATGELSQMAGYRGLSVSGDRASGQVVVVGLWDTLSQLQASESAVAKNRQGAAGAFGASVKVEVFEVILQEAGTTPPALGCPVLTRRARTDPEHLEAALAYTREVTVPAVKAQPGFRAMLGLLDRERCEAVVGVIFGDRESLEAARRAVEASAEAGARSVGTERGEPEVRELLFAHLP